MSLVAAKAPYVLEILYDDMAESPREDHDNFGTMVCWHSRYALGDKHDYDDPDEFMQELVQKTVPAKEIVAFVKSGSAEDVRLAYDRSVHGWTAESYDRQFKKWFNEITFEGKLQDGISEISEAIIPVLSRTDLHALAGRKNCIMPLYLYDHSMISMSTSTFIGRAQHAEWDSGQVGWIYAGHDRVQEEYGAVTPETVEKAQNFLRGEVEEYDCYLTNQCYGFRLYQDGAETDSCWGFLGYISDVKEAIASHLPEGYRDMVDNMTDLFDKNIEDYLEENETEEMEKVL